jgi:hypothetical protein
MGDSEQRSVKKIEEWMRPRAKEAYEEFIATLPEPGRSKFCTGICRMMFEAGFASGAAAMAGMALEDFTR